MRGRDHTLLEVVIVAAIGVLLAGIALSLMISVQRRAGDSAAWEQATSHSRTVLDRLVSELHTLNLTVDDLEPDAPLDATSIQYRRVIGYDAVTDTILLEPPPSSGTFLELALTPDGNVVRRGPGGARTLAARVSDLRFTLVPPDELKIQVAVSQRDSEGQVIRVTAEKTLWLQNKVTSGTN